jgi:hypothetical protein
MIERIHHLEADVVGLCETSINWNTNTTRRLYSQILSKKLKKNNLVVARIANKSTNCNLPGGTASVTVQSMVNKIEQTIEDDNHMGRWTGTTYRISKSKKLNVISAYRVIDQQVKANNSMSSNSQQHHMLANRDIHDIKPRRQFIIDFCNQFKEKCLDPNELTLLMIDANECTSHPENGGITELLEQCGLQNLYKALHEDNSEFPTHISGSQTI